MGMSIKIPGVTFTNTIGLDVPQKLNLLSWLVLGGTQANSQKNQSGGTDGQVPTLTFNPYSMPLNGITVNTMVAPRNGYSFMLVAKGGAAMGNYGDNAANDNKMGFGTEGGMIRMTGKGVAFGGLELAAPAGYGAKFVFYGCTCDLSLDILYAGNGSGNLVTASRTISYPAPAAEAAPIKLPCPGLTAQFGSAMTDIAAVAIWNRALSAAEMKEVYDFCNTYYTPKLNAL